MKSHKTITFNELIEKRGWDTEKIPLYLAKNHTLSTYVNGIYDLLTVIATENRLNKMQIKFRKEI